MLNSTGPPPGARRTPACQPWTPGPTLLPMRTATALLISGLAMGAVPAPVAAPVVHDAEHTQVELRFFSDHTYQIDVMNPPGWFITTLEPLAEVPSQTILEGDARNRRLEDLRGKFAEWIWLLFDGERIEAFPEYVPEERKGPVPDSIAPPLTTMRIRGRVPEGAKQFSFAYGLVLDPYPITVIGGDGEGQVTWVEGPVESDKLDIEALMPPPWYEVILTYLKLGFQHILPNGANYILFAVGIFLLSTSVLPLLAQVTAFTVAHAIALALTTFGVITLRPTIVGPMIGLSIAYLASESLFKTKLERGRMGMVFVLGLLFGAGFGEALKLPNSGHATALASFNLGIAGAEVTVIVVLFLLLGWSRKKEWYRQRVVLPLSVLVGVLGLYLTVTRLFGG